MEKQLSAASVRGDTGSDGNLSEISSIKMESQATRQVAVPALGLSLHRVFTSV